MIYPVPPPFTPSYPLPNKYPSITSTTHLTNFVPFAFFTVIVTVPDAFAVTSPVLFTVATSVLLLVHCTFSVASAGVTVAVSWAVWLTSIFLLVELTAILIIDVWTVTSQVAVNPFSVFTVILASPFPINVKFPFSTVTTFLLLLSHTMLLFTYVVSGNIVASNFGIFDEFLSNTNLE